MPNMRPDIIILTPNETTILNRAFDALIEDHPKNPAVPYVSTPEIRGWRTFDYYTERLLIDDNMPHPLMTLMNKGFLYGRGASNPLDGTEYALTSHGLNYHVLRDAAAVAAADREEDSGDTITLPRSLAQELLEFVHSNAYPAEYAAPFIAALESALGPEEPESSTPTPAPEEQTIRFRVDTGVAYLDPDGYTYVSTDGGATWRRKGEDNP